MLTSPTQLQNISFHVVNTTVANVQRMKTTRTNCIEQKCCKICIEQKCQICKFEFSSLPYNLPPTDRLRSIADRNSYPSLSVFFSSHFYEKSMNVPAELTIVPVKKLFVQIRLTHKSPAASLDTVTAAEIREL